MKQLTTILFILIAFGIKAQDSAQVKIDTIPVYIVVEDAETDDPIRVVEGEYLVQHNGNTVLGSLIRYKAINDQGKFEWKAITKNEFIHIITKKK